VKLILLVGEKYVANILITIRAGRENC
jgi:hypothetical protein